MTLAISLAVFYEVFWLDLFPAGTYMPPNALFPMLCVLSLSLANQHTDITSLFLPVILTLPLASFGSYLEKRQREWQVASYNRLILAFRAGNDLEKATSRSIFASLAQLFSLNCAVFCIISSLVLFGASFLTNNLGQSLLYPNASWPLLWTIGAVGGLLSLRIRRNYIIFALGSIGIGLIFLLG
jgi:hypothetical protein